MKTLKGVKKGSDEHREFVWRRGIELTPLREKVFRALEEDSTISLDQLRNLDVKILKLPPTTVRTWRKRFLRRLEKRGNPMKNEPAASQETCEKIVSAYLKKFVDIKDERDRLRLENAQLKSASEGLIREINRLKNDNQRLRNAGKLPVEQLKHVIATPSGD